MENAKFGLSERRFRNFTNIWGRKVGRRKEDVVERVTMFSIVNKQWSKVGPQEF